MLYDYKNSQKSHESKHKRSNQVQVNGSQESVSYIIYMTYTKPISTSTNLSREET